eukprot:scaffold15457_cov66-Phaeocystis_antarctica.AAC.2
METRHPSLMILRMRETYREPLFDYERNVLATRRRGPGPCVRWVAGGVPCPRLRVGYSPCHAVRHRERVERALLVGPAHRVGARLEMYGSMTSYSSTAHGSSTSKIADGTALWARAVHRKAGHFRR